MNRITTFFLTVVLGCIVLAPFDLFLTIIDWLDDFIRMLWLHLRLTFLGIDRKTQEIKDHERKVKKCEFALKVQKLTLELVKKTKSVPEVIEELRRIKQERKRECRY